MVSLSIVMPVLNEEATLKTCLQTLQPLRQRGCELIVVDGGSNDSSSAVAEPLADQVLTAAKGRANQMNAGAQAARGDVIWFLHSDSTPPSPADQLIIAALQKTKRVWGRFDVKLSGKQPLLRLVAALMNARSRLTGIATGDQGIFVTRAAFNQVGGYPAIPLMEDIAISRALKKLSRPICLRQRMITSSRRWEQNGILKTILLMWSLRLAYFLGVDPKRLVRIYYGR
jgi:rSAM/selenodomain-associated transferase 2